MCQLELKTPLLPPKEQDSGLHKGIQVHKLWTKVYYQKGLTAMINCPCYEYDFDQLLIQ